MGGECWNNGGLPSIYQGAVVRPREPRILYLDPPQFTANLVLQANVRLLRASLVFGIPNAAIEYDRRASEIESLVQKRVERESASLQELNQAKSVRLDPLLNTLLN